jgi:hypothetical protein
VTGISIELKTECKYCGTALPLNALVEEILCHSCQKTLNFPYEYWRKSILDSAVSEGLKFNENEGRNQTAMTGEYTFHITYGRQHPRCPKCKTGLDDSKFVEYAAAGNTKCTKCQNEISVREAPENIKKLFPGISYLAGEDSDMFSSDKPASVTEQSSKPVIFTCPSCAGALEIDGKERMITCKFCNSEVYLPDDLWFRLHPAKTVNRWYLVYDDKFVKERILAWYELAGCASDKDGNIYMFSKGDDDDDFTLWSFGKDMKTRWSKIMKGYNESDTWLVFGRDNVIYLINKDKQNVNKISPSDGSVIKVIKGKESSDEKQHVFNIRQCDSMAVDKDGSIIALIDDHILKFDNDGENIPLWEDDGHGGFFGKLSHMFNPDDDSDPSVKELKNRPARINSYDTTVCYDWDGNIFFLDTDSGEEACLAMFDKKGEKTFSSAVPLLEKVGGPGFDNKGDVYVLGKDKDEIMSLVKLSRGSGSWGTIITDVTKGGFLSDEEKLVVTPDGMIYCLCYGNGIKIFDQSLKMIYISDDSKEDDTDKIEEHNKKDG